MIFATFGLVPRSSPESDDRLGWWNVNEACVQPAFAIAAPAPPPPTAATPAAGEAAPEKPRSDVPSEESAMPVAVLIQVIEMLSAFAGQVPELVAAGQTVADLLRTGKNPTPEQLAAFDAALDAANTALQRA